MSDEPGLGRGLSASKTEAVEQHTERLHSVADFLSEAADATEKLSVIEALAKAAPTLGGARRPLRPVRTTSSWAGRFSMKKSIFEGPRYAPMWSSSTAGMK
jgi:hypothetical protein